LPRRLDDGARNSYRIVRLKDKLGTKSMASGEIMLDGAIAYLVGDARNGFKQMMDQVNLSRLSHGVRAAAMMRRCLNESIQVGRTRSAFGRKLIEMPLVKKQLMKIMLPTEQALSMYAYTADVMGRANQGEEGANQILRLLTPLYKFRSCRDNIRVATGAMEMRGGMGYIEDFVNARLVRDAHVGVLWEGTSNIAALDAIARAVGKLHSQEALAGSLKTLVRESSQAPEQFRMRLDATIDKVTAFATEVASRAENEDWARLAAGALYHATSAVLMAWEASRANNGKRLLLSRMILEHRLTPEDPMAMRDHRWESKAADLLLRDANVSLAEAIPLLG